MKRLLFLVVVVCLFAGLVQAQPSPAPANRNRLILQAQSGAPATPAPLDSITFSGSGLNDARNGGAYNSTSIATFTVTLSTAGTPDQFTWTESGGSASSGGPTSITGSAQTLANGVTITFTATTGHHAADVWTITETPVITMYWDTSGAMQALWSNNTTVPMTGGGGGSSFDPASPGPIGATTPSTGKFTTLNVGNGTFAVDSSGYLNTVTGIFSTIPDNSVFLDLDTHYFGGTKTAAEIDGDGRVYAGYFVTSGFIDTVDLYLRGISGKTTNFLEARKSDNTLLASIDKDGNSTFVKITGPVTALKSATTSVDVSAATAPTAGQILTAVDSTHATWQAAAGGGASLTAANTFTTNGALSTPAELYTGTWITGGSATSTKPFFLIETSGAGSTAWSTAGTGFAVNAASGFVGNLADFQLNGTSKASINYAALMQVGVKTFIGNWPANASFGSISATSDSGGTNYSMIMDGSSTYINAPASGSILFRNANADIGSIGVGGFSMGGATISNTGAIAGTTGAFSGQLSSTKSGAVSTPAVILTGTPFVGTATTSHPLFYLNGGTAPTTWNNTASGGTYIGVNSIASFAGRFIDFRVNGGSTLFNVDNTGIVTAGNGFTAATGTNIQWSGRSVIRSSADGLIDVTNSGGTSFTRLGFGGTTSSFVAIASSATGFNLTLGDGTGNATLQAGATTIPVAGAASTPGLLLSGAVFTGGSATTNFPLLFVQPTAATAATNWSANGTVIGINMPTFSGDFINFQQNGTSIMSLTNSPNAVLSVTGKINATLSLNIASTVALSGASNVMLVRNNAQGAIGGIQVGRVVVNRTADLTLTYDLSNNVYTNVGASGAVIFTLPTAVATPGISYTFYVGAAQTLQVTATGSGTIRCRGSVTSTNGNIQCSTIGDSITIQSVSATSWVATESSLGALADITFN